MRNCAEKLLSEKGYVAPIELLVEMNRVTGEQVEDWRLKRIWYLEKVVVGNLSKMNTILKFLGKFARDHELKPSTTHYKSLGKSKL